MPENRDIPEKVQHFLENEILDEPVEGLSPETPLLSYGIIDSLGMTSLVAFISDEFGVSVTNDDVTVENFQTIATISLLIAEKKSSAEKAGTAGSGIQDEATALLISQGVSSACIDLDRDTRIHTLETPGAHPPWLLLPGLGAPASSWSPFLLSCKDEQACVAVDYPGFGLSVGSGDEPTWEDQAEILKQLVIQHQNLRNGCTVIGSSAGALLALRLAREIPDYIHKIVMLGFGYIEDEGAWLEKLYKLADSPEQFLDLAYYQPPKLNNMLRRQINDAMNRPAYRSFMTGRDIFKKSFQPVKAASLIIGGLNDQIIGKEALKKAAGLLPNSSLIEIPRCGHFPGNERSEEVIFYIKRFEKQQRAEKYA